MRSHFEEQLFRRNRVNSVVTGSCAVSFLFLLAGIFLGSHDNARVLAGWQQANFSQLFCKRATGSEGKIDIHNENIDRMLFQNGHQFFRSRYGAEPVTTFAQHLLEKIDMRKIFVCKHDDWLVLNQTFHWAFLMTLLVTSNCRFI